MSRKGGETWGTLRMTSVGEGETPSGQPAGRRRYGRYWGFEGLPPASGPPICVPITSPETTMSTRRFS